MPSSVTGRRLDAQTPIRGLRWWIGGLLFASTVINYIDRQSLSVMAPYLKADYRWSNEQFAMVIIGFRIAYALGQAVAGRFIDRVGTRTGLSISVLWYSLAAMLTPLATGLRSLCTFRFLLGAGESANWPGATKAVSEWFPRQERGWAVALFDSGSAVGGALAPLLVLGLYRLLGGWRPAFAIPGLLGLAWLAVWRRVYRPPEEHPRISPQERRMILEDRGRERMDLPQACWSDVLRLRETWGIIFGRLLTDPVWYFVTDWFGIYIVARHIGLERGVLASWAPFLAADAGNFLGGGISSRLVKRGWSAVAARKAVIVVSGCGMTMLVPAVFTSNLWALAGLFSVATCCYAAWSTMALTLPSDLYPENWVASVSGLSGFGSGIGTIASTYLIGRTADRYSFTP
ncbi:MAG TPA: MFS transporter, partial [Candidatus Sulfopaludibacter sp.]|nr:MFS transporter [Candidatus Sulfopaludibacter sp.]